jgi:hypothetical protein
MKYFNMHKTPGLAHVRSRNLKVKEKKKRGKPIPLQAWTGPEGSRRLRLQYFKTIGT